MTEHNPYSAPESEVAVNSHGGMSYQPKVFSTQGRIGRMRYWVYNMAVTLVLYLLMVLSMGLAAMIGGGFDPSQGVAGLGVVGMIGYFGSIILGMAMMFIYAKRRLNDVNLSGWFGLIMLVPLVNIILYFYLLLASGKNDNNQYGAAPVPNSTGVKVAFAISLIVIFAGLLGVITYVIPVYVDAIQQAAG